MPFTTAISSTSLFGFGLSNIAKYIGSLWIYNSSAPAAWTTLANWYRDSSHTTQSSDFPKTTNDAILLSNTTADLENWSAPASINLNGYNLDVTAHPFVLSEEPPGYTCAAPYNFSIPITGESEQNIVSFEGHINII